MGKTHLTKFDLKRKGNAEGSLGILRIEIGIGDAEREHWTTLEALVDTGASITAVPASVLRDLGVEPTMRRRFESAHGVSREMEVGQTWVSVEGEEILTYVLFNDEGTTPLLGALALEMAFLGVDPVHQKLVSVAGLI